MKKGLLLTFQIAGHLAYMVLVPLFLFGGLGLILDRSMNTTPLSLLIGIGLAFASTVYWIKKRLIDVIKAAE